LIPKIKVYLKYIISLLIAGGLLWYVYHDIDLKAMLGRLEDINYRWFALSITLSLLSHAARAYRWNILFTPFHYQLSTLRTFLAVMVGYFANLLIPRMGEVTRCGILKRTDDVPITISIGTVVTERLIDALCLFSLIVFTLILEFNRLGPFFFGFFETRFKSLQLGAALWWIIFAGIVAFIVVAYFLIKRLRNSQRIRNNRIFIKIKGVGEELLYGIMSIRRIKNKSGFILSTCFIWLLYFLMSYVVFFSMPQTAGLGIRAGLAILIMGGIGMSAPVQGGIGAFHILVSSVLVLYGISEEDGVLFATILHTSQMLMVILTGSICLLAVLVISKRNSRSKLRNA
jgi:glycosyltransferase 2 family protein